MAYFESFALNSTEIYETSGWIFSSTTVIDSTITRRFNDSGTDRGDDFSVKFPGNSGSASSKIFSEQYRHLYHSFYIQSSSPSSTAGQQINLIQNGTTNFTVFMYSDGLVKVYRGTHQGTLLQTSSIGFSMNNWHDCYIDIVVAEAGSIVVKIDQTEFINYTGDTRNGTEDGFNRITFATSGSGAPASYFGNLMFFTSAEGAIAADDTACFFNTMLVSADDIAGLTPSTGTDNYALLTEIPPSMAQYVSGIIAGAKDTYTHDPMSFSSAVILGVKVFVYGTVEGVISELIPMLKVEGTEHEGTGQTPGASGVPGLIEHYWMENPETSDAWSVAEVNDALIGVKLG